ncbi:MAG: ribosome biogenesis GTP-binding protein YihA/YsxC [Gammaproteobacteria bacterium]|nr:ribosome biogenesis GTP-binding protein YihA/YsxC [Gammaproteobacteria bacterium]
MDSPVSALLRRAHFTIAVNAIKQLPTDTGIEIGFAGRSNAGKSSAINTITGIKSLARTSKTPGRTQQIIYFDLDEERRLVDLPGYGFAKVPEKIKKHWQGLMEGYFQRRKSLHGVVLVMDVRHPLKPFDIQMLEWCKDTNTPVQILLTKADKLSRGAADKQLHATKKALKQQGLLLGELQLFSSLSGTGKEQVIEKLEEWLAPTPAVDVGTDDE